MDGMVSPFPPSHPERSTGSLLGDPPPPDPEEAGRAGLTGSPAAPRAPSCPLAPCTGNKMGEGYIIGNTVLVPMQGLSEPPAGQSGDPQGGVCRCRKQVWPPRHVALYPILATQDAGSTRRFVFTQKGLRGADAQAHGSQGAWDPAQAGPPTGSPRKLEPLPQKQTAKKPKPRRTPKRKGI